MTQQMWLIDEAKPLDGATLRQLARQLPTGRWGDTRGEQITPQLAIRVQDLIIHDTRKWFGEADIRLDVLVVHGNGTNERPESFYTPQTFRFPRVMSGERLPTGETGLLVFYGKPLYFLDIFLTVSRDRKDSDTLAALLSQQLQSAEVQGALDTLLGLAVAAPQVATVTAAIGATAVLGNFAYQVLRQATGSTVGLYHNSWIQYRDRFWLGRHPETGMYKVKDLSFWYEVVLDQ